MTPAAEKLPARGKVVAPADVLVAMGLPNPKYPTDWRRGRVPCLERVITCDLSRLSRRLRSLPFHAQDLNLVPTAAADMRSGEGPFHPPKRERCKALKSR